MARHNRPRQNLSLGPNQGGFGSGNSNATSAPQGGGGGGGNNRPRNRPIRPNNGGSNDNPFAATPLSVGTTTLSGTGVQINQTPSFQDWLQQQGINVNNLNPNRRQRLKEQWQAIADASAAGAAPAASSTRGSIFDSTGSMQSGEPDAYEATAWGLLNNAGIDQSSPFGSSQVDFIRNQIENWWDEWQGEGAIEGEGRQDFTDFLYGRGGVAVPETPDAAWVQNTWGPAIRQRLAAMYQSATPRNRGVDMRQWVAPRRTIQF